MTEELKKESMNALKEFAKHKNSYENMPDNLKNENIIFGGKLYSGTLDIKLLKNDVEFYICCLNKKKHLISAMSLYKIWIINPYFHLMKFYLNLIIRSSNLLRVVLTGFWNK